MKKQKPQIILGVDPGSKETGVAILRGEELIYYGVKTFRNRKTERASLEEVRQTFQKLIDEYQPTKMVIEKSFHAQYQTLCYLGAVTEEIKKSGLRNNINSEEYSTRTVRSELCSSGNATKIETAQVVCQHFPELAKHLNSVTRTKMLYWGHVFDAVALLLYDKYCET